MSDDTDEVSPPRRRTRLKAEARQAQILAAALDLFGERGYWGTSLQDVAERCDFTVTGVLYHFGSKEGLLRALLDSRDRAYVQDLLSRRGDDASTYRLGETVSDVDMATICRILVQLSVEDPARTRLYSRMENESTDPRHPAHDFFLRREQRLLDAYEVNVPDSVENAQACARMVMALISGLRVQWLRDPEGMDLLELWDQVVAGIPILRGGGAAADGGVVSSGAELPAE